MVKKIFFALLLLPSIAFAQPGGNPLPVGAATEATLSTRLSIADFDTKTGSLTEAAPATDTASSGLNGRLQRIAQRLTSLIALLPASLTGSGNLKVSLQESNASQSVTQGTSPWVTSGTSTVTQGTSPWVVSGTVTGGIPTASAITTQSVISVADSSTSVLALNASRKGGWVKNISVSDIYVNFSATATTAAPTLLEPGDVLELGQGGTVVYTGAVSAIHAVAGQSRSLEVVEF